jgi:zinc protease
VATVFGKNSPYGAQVEYANVDRINRADLVAFYQRYFFPKNVICRSKAISTPPTMKAGSKPLFDDWKPEQPAVPAFPKAGDAAHPGNFWR